MTKLTPTAEQLAIPPGRVGHITRVVYRDNSFEYLELVRTGVWRPWEPPPAAPVTVRREDFDALRAALRENGQMQNAQSVDRAAVALIDNADLGADA